MRLALMLALAGLGPAPGYSATPAQAQLRPASPLRL